MKNWWERLMVQLYGKPVEFWIKEVAGDQGVRVFVDRRFSRNVKVAIRFCERRNIPYKYNLAG